MGEWNEGELRRKVVGVEQWRRKANGRLSFGMEGAESGEEW